MLKHFLLFLCFTQQHRLNQWCEFWGGVIYFYNQWVLGWGDLFLQPMADGVGVCDKLFYVGKVSLVMLVVQKEHITLSKHMKRAQKHFNVLLP